MTKELEDALGNLAQQAYNSADNEKQLQKDKEHYELIKNELKDSEECKEVLELLMKKYGFRVYEFKDDAGNEHKCLTTHFPRDGWFPLPQEEYDLLKRRLKNV